jgi:hypothetical protein
MKANLILILIALVAFAPLAEAKPKYQVRRANGRFAPWWFHFGLPVVKWEDCPATPDKQPPPFWTPNYANPITGRY